MKKIGILLSMLLFVGIGTAQNVEQDKEAIKKAIQTGYVEGLQNEGNAEKIDLGIHPEFAMIGVGKDGVVWKYTINDWKASALKKKAEGKLPLTGENKISVKFLHVDITGNSAVAKIAYFVGEKQTYVDYISLYKFDNGWRMVSKIFHKL